MKAAIVLLAATLLGIAPHALAESASEAMREFGLIGKWSVNCAMAPTEPCERHPETGLIRRCGVRIVFEAPYIGLPIRTRLTSSIDLHSTEPQILTSPIQSAVRVTNEKIRLTYEIFGQPPPIPATTWQPQNGEVWEVVYEKVGNKLRTDTFKRVDGAKVNILNGNYWMPAGEWNADRPPTNWRDTGKPTELFERCLN